METMTAPTRPSLEGRIARCCKETPEVPSDYSLPFFEYNGPGSEKATEMCKCGYLRIAHEYFPYYYPGKCKIDRGDLYIDDSGLFHCKTCTQLYYPHELKAVLNLWYKPHDFTPIGDTKDKYYCGHSGWD